MKANRVKQALKAGDSVLGTMIHEVRNPELAYLLAAAGMDFLLVDTEHASPDTETIQNLTRAAKSAGMVPLARVTDNEYFLIARTLDMGVMGVMVPRVDTRQEAERAVAAVKYPPEGRRGFGMRPVITDYESTSVPEAMAWSNENTLVILQVESEAAVANLEQITRVPGVDVSLVGLNDLSISLGVPGDFKHPRIEEALRRVFEVCPQNGVSPAVHVSDIESAKRYRARGMRFIMLASESRLLMKVASHAVREIMGDPRREGKGLY
jgi:2-keto-3-deoxy-L-rhamnonate aldolase RhmA